MHAEVGDAHDGRVAHVVVAVLEVGQQRVQEGVILEDGGEGLRHRHHEHPARFLRREAHPLRTQTPQQVHLDELTLDLLVEQHHQPSERLAVGLGGLSPLHHSRLHHVALEDLLLVVITLCLELHHQHLVEERLRPLQVQVGQQRTQQQLHEGVPLIHLLEGILDQLEHLLDGVLLDRVGLAGACGSPLLVLLILAHQFLLMGGVLLRTQEEQGEEERQPQHHLLTVLRQHVGEVGGEQVGELGLHLHRRGLQVDQAEQELKSIRALG